MRQISEGLEARQRPIDDTAVHRFCPFSITPKGLCAQTPRPNVEAEIVVRLVSDLHLHAQDPV